LTSRPPSIQNLASNKKVKKYLKYVRLDDDAETILIKYLGEDFIPPKLQDREKIMTEPADTQGQDFWMT